MTDGGPGEVDAGEGGGAALFSVETLEVVEAEPLSTSGLGVALRADGRWAVAYAARGEGTFTCETLTGGAVEGGENVDVMVADEAVDGTVRVRRVSTVPGVKPGSIDLAVDPLSDALIVVYPGGAPANGYCGASDLAVAVESGEGFVETIVATDSATGATCRYVEDPFCEIGDTVGLYPGIAVDDDGAIAIAHQDLHNGFADKDLYGSDLEMLRGPSATSLQARTVSAEVGGAYHASIAFGPDGRVVLGHAVLGNAEFPDGQGGTYSIEKGIWAVVEQADGSFRESLIARAIETDGRVSVGHHPQAGYALAYHARGDDDLLVYTSRDDGETWQAHDADRLGRTGRDPSIAFLSDGTLLVAYGHCGGGTGDACPRSDDGAKVAILEDGRFKKQLLPGDDEDVEGKDTDVAARLVGGEDRIAVASLNTSQALLVVHLLSKR